MEIPSGFRRLIAGSLFILGLTGAGLIARAADTGIQNPDELHVWFFDVGQGDATLIVTPHGHRLLIDGGQDRTVLAKLGEVLPPWDRRVDAILLTHPDADHETGLVSVLERYKVGRIYETGLERMTGVDRAFAEAKVPHQLLKAGDRVELDDVRFDVLSPVGRPPVSSKETNDYSLVVRLVFKETSLLFMGDLPETLEGTLLKEQVGSDVFKVGHHGSRLSSSPTFLNAVHPQTAIISVGAGNLYGHPHPVVLDRLHTRSIQVWRTDQSGDILLTASNDEPKTTPKPLPF